MAIINITTTHGAVPPEARPGLAKDLAALTYAAEGFAGSSVAPQICWTFFDERADRAFSTGAGDPRQPLYYVEITILSGVIDRSAKETLGAAMTRVLLAQEPVPPVPQNSDRVWVRFVEVPDGDLIIGGQTTSLAGLRAFVANGQ